MTFRNLIAFCLSAILALWANSAIAQLSIDGSAKGLTTGVNAISGAVTSGNITTVHAGDILVVTAFSETKNASGGYATAAISDNTGLSLVWHLRKQKQFENTLTPNWQDSEVWWAYCPSAITNKTVTATFTGPTNTLVDDISIAVFGVTGFTGTAYQTTPWDVNTSFPATNNSVSGDPSITSVSTTSSAGMPISFAAATGSAALGAPTSPGTWTTIETANTSSGQNSLTYNTAYTVYSSQQSSITISWGVASNYTIAYADALTIPTSGPAAGSLLLLGVGD